MPQIEAIREQVIFQNQNRSVWQEHDKQESLHAQIVEENEELLEAVEIDKPAFEVASEIGDIEYLCIKYEHSYGALPDELRYIRTWAWKLAELVGLDVYDCVEMKLIRNDLKYPAAILNNHPYEEGMQIAKDNYKAMGGDAAFSHSYLDRLSRE